MPLLSSATRCQPSFCRRLLAPVLPAAFPRPAGTIASASWDHSVRLWDAELAACRDMLHHNKAVYAVAAAPGGAGLVAFGGAEKALRVGAALRCAVLSQPASTSVWHSCWCMLA